MLVVEYRVASPILQEALERAPETTVSYEEQYRTDEGIRYLFWAEGGKWADFEDGLAADPTVRDPVVLTETETGRLYRVMFTEEGEEAATFPLWSDLDVSILTSTGTNEGWEARMRMPDRSSLQRFQDLCEERDLQFRLLSVYEESESPGGSNAQLTSVQEETLVAARELGYFEIPRQASLAEVADELGVSPQATSERIRRGTANLVDATLLAINA